MSQRASTFKFYCSDPFFAGKFSEIQTALRERTGAILGDRMDSPKRKRLILKVNLNGKFYVVKQEFFIFRFDRSLKAFLFGSDARAVFNVSRHAQEQNFSGIPKTFFVAERFSKGVLRETVSVTEFLEGSGLSLPLEPELARELETLITHCHALGIISGDIQTANFIRTPEGLKLIDFRGKKVIPWLAKIRDRIQIQRVFGIKYEGRDSLPGKIFFALLACRNAVRKLFGKEKIPD